MTPRIEKEFLTAHQGKVKGGGKHGVKIEHCERRDEEILSVYFAEVHSFNPLASQQAAPG